MLMPPGRMLLRVRVVVGYTRETLHIVFVFHPAGSTFRPRPLLIFFHITFLSHRFDILFGKSVSKEFFYSRDSIAAG